jgi:RNA 2',3'-cyclic 3'-phosphodiesterase
MKRLFIAIGAEGFSFDPNLSFKKILVNLKEREIEHRWVSPANYHVTLNFLGDLPSEYLPILQGALLEVAGKHDAFDLKVEGISAFPDEQAGRVLWVGIQNSVSLRSLYSDCKQLLKELNLLVENRSYIPHLTIARLRNQRNVKDLISPLKNKKFGSLSVNKMFLIESKLAGVFPVYESLMEFPLGQ